MNVTSDFLQDTDNKKFVQLFLKSTTNVYISVLIDKLFYQVRNPF